MGDFNDRGPRRPVGWWVAPVAALCFAWGVAQPLAASATPAVAQAALIATLQGDPAFPPELNQLLQAGQYPEALAFVTAHPELMGDEKGFLLDIHLLRITHQDDQALTLLEHRLSSDPEDGLARFEVAEIHFSHHRERPAILNYRLALAGTLDEGRTAAARARMEGIVQRKAWHSWMGASLSPNNSINDTTDITRMALFGLPFSEQAPGVDKKGLSFSGYIGAGKLVALSPGLGIRTNILAAASHEPGRLFDSRSLSIQSGPEWTFGHITHVSVSGRAIVQWLGKDLAMSGGGLSVHGDTYGDDQLWSGDVSADRLDIRYNNIGQAWNYRGEVKRVRYLDSSSLWIMDVVAARRGASFDTESYSEEMVKVGRLLQAPLSTFVYLEATGRVRRYDRNAAFSGMGRDDDYGQLTARFSKRDVVIYGAMPFVSVSASQNASSINTYDSSHVRVDFGFTRDF